AECHDGRGAGDDCKPDSHVKSSHLCKDSHVLYLPTFQWLSRTDRTAPRRTSVPAIMCSSEANSFSLWLIPSLQGMKIMAEGATFAMFHASWPARLGRLRV